MSETEFLPKIAMSIHAHPDDQEFTVAGTLARWAQNGCRVIPVIVTSGDAGAVGHEWFCLFAHLLHPPFLG